MTRLTAALLAVLLAGSCAGVRADPAESPYRRVRSILGRVTITDDLPDTVHAEPRVLEAIGLFLTAAGGESLTDDQLHERFSRLIPVPPWEWVPSTDFRRIDRGLYLVALGAAASTQPSSLYLFEGSHHVRIDFGASGTIQVERVDVDGDRIEVAYFPIPTGSAPRLASAVVRRRGATWDVDHDTPYRRSGALLARVPPEDMLSPGVHRNPLVLEAIGVYLESAGRLSDEELHRHLSWICPPTWHQAWPWHRVQRLGPALYLVTLEPRTPAASGGSLHLFEGAAHVRLVSDDDRSILVDDVAVSAGRVEVTFRRTDPGASEEPGVAVAERTGGTWRVRTSP